MLLACDVLFHSFGHGLALLVEFAQQGFLLARYLFGFTLRSSLQCAVFCFFLQLSFAVFILLLDLLLDLGLPDFLRASNRLFDLCKLILFDFLQFFEFQSDAVLRIRPPFLALSLLRLHVLPDILIMPS